MKLSIIIPVYHTQDTLPRCLDSILRQSFTDYEVILVDDGSTDDSPKICDAYSRQDGRVKVIHKENGGLSDARNTGILQAKGEYITFIDSDDTIAEDTLSLVIEKIITYPETDILEYPVMERLGNGPKEHLLSFKEKEYQNEEEIFKFFYFLSCLDLYYEKKDEIIKLFFENIGKERKKELLKNLIQKINSSNLFPELKSDNIFEIYDFFSSYYGNFLGETIFNLFSNFYDDEIFTEIYELNLKYFYILTISGLINPKTFFQKIAASRCYPNGTSPAGQAEKERRVYGRNFIRPGLKAGLWPGDGGHPGPGRRVPVGGAGGVRGHHGSLRLGQDHSHRGFAL